MNAHATDIKAEAPAFTGPHVFQAITAVMADLSHEGIGKGRMTEGNGPKFKFRGIDDVYNALAPVLAQHHLVILPRILSRESVERTTNSGGRLCYTTVEAEYQIVSALDGSSTLARTFGEAMDSGDKSTNKAMAVAYKYMAIQTFCIPTEGDNDPDATVHQVAPVKPEAKRVEPKAPTLAERANRLEATLKATKTEDELNKAWSLGAKLCADLDTADPERLQELLGLYTARGVEFLEAAQ